MRTEPTSHEGREEGLASRLFRKGFHFFSERVWDSELKSLPRTRALLFRMARVGYLAVRGIHEHRVFVRASALTYITILSIVPLLAFAFSVAKGFGFYERLVHEQIEPFLAQILPHATVETGEVDARSEFLRQAIDRVLQFVQETDFTKLSWVGLLVLVYAVIRLLGTIEAAFNAIWGVTRARSILRKVSDYLSMVVVTPILLVAGAGIAAAARTNASLVLLQQRLGVGGMVEFLLGLSSLLAIWVGFTFLYVAMPNTRVRIGSALLGGAFAAALWYGVQLLHIQFQVGIARYNAIYSSFAAIPIFLVWINLSWAIVLCGAELACAHQTEPTYAQVERKIVTTEAARERLALRAMARIARRFLDALEPPTAAELALEVGVPVRAVGEVLEILRRASLVAETDRGSDDVGYLPARDLDQVGVKSVLDAVRGDPGEAPARGPLDERVQELLTGIDAAVESSPHNVTLRELAWGDAGQRVPVLRGKGSARSAAT